MRQRVRRPAEHVVSRTTIDDGPVTRERELEVGQRLADRVDGVAIDDDRGADDERAMQPEVRGAVRERESPSREVAVNDLESRCHPLDRGNTSDGSSVDGGSEPSLNTTSGSSLGCTYRSSESSAALPAACLTVSDQTFAHIGRSTP